MYMVFEKNDLYISRKQVDRSLMRLVNNLVENKKAKF